MGKKKVSWKDACRDMNWQGHLSGRGPVARKTLRLAKELFATFDFDPKHWEAFKKEILAEVWYSLYTANGFVKPCITAKVTKTGRIHAN